METRDRKIAVTLFALFLAVRGHAADFEKANDLYDAGRFVEAKQLYEQFVDAGPWSANLFYNLGNADYRIGSPGRAMLDYERALAIAPEHPEALANLKLLREQTHASTLTGPFFESAMLRVREDMWTLLSALAAWTAAICLALLFTRTPRARAGLWFGAIAGLGVAAISVFGISLHTRDRALAVVTAKEVEAHLAPAESAGLAGVLPAGSRVRVLSERGPWTYCQLPEGRRGWVASGAIERVRPGITPVPGVGGGVTPPRTFGDARFRTRAPARGARL